MDNVEGRDMVVPFSQDEEERIEKFDELGQVVPPTGLSHPHSNGIVRVVYRLTSERVVAPPTGCQALRFKRFANILEYQFPSIVAGIFIRAKAQREGEYHLPRKRARSRS